jgi:hypothetical protein
MPSEYTVETGKATPENKGGPRIGVGARVFASRVSDGSIAVQLLRGDGGTPEAYGVIVRTKYYGPFLADVEAELTIAEIDLALADFTPRGYRLRVFTDGGADLAVRDAFIATEPYSVAGAG